MVNFIMENILFLLLLNDIFVDILYVLCYWNQYTVYMYVYMEYKLKDSSFNNNIKWGGESLIWYIGI